jgi:hypothetical protein
MLSILHNLTERDMPVALVARTLTQFSFSEKIKLVQMSNEAIQFAHDLYHTLRTLDQQQFKHIMIEAVPDNSEWDAIRDRIYKATALRN